MSSETIEKLNQIDLSKLTAEDLKNIKSPVLRDCLIRIIGGGKGGDPGSAQTDTTTTHSSFTKMIRP